MMIKEDQLRDFRPNVRYPNGENLTLEMVQEAIEEKASEYGIPIAFYNDEVQSGGLFNRTKEKCLIMYHPEHQNDYYNFCFRINMQGSLAIVKVQIFGKSKQRRKDSLAWAYKKTRKGETMTNKAILLAAQGIMTLGRNKQKLEEENTYYEIIYEILDEVIN